MKFINSENIFRYIEWTWHCCETRKEFKLCPASATTIKLRYENANVIDCFLIDHEHWNKFAEL
jgi:hypothetical protein